VVKQQAAARQQIAVRQQIAARQQIAVRQQDAIKAERYDMRNKKLALAAVIILSAALLAGNLSAASVRGGAHWSDAVVREAAWGTPVIDGVISSGEWDHAPVITVTLDDPVVNEYGIYQGGWESDRSNTADFATEVRFLWDDKSLYIYENRTDDDVILDGSSETPWSGADGNLIFLQVADDDSPMNPEGWGHHIFYIVGNDSGDWGGATAVRIVNESDGSRETVHYDEMKAVAFKTSNGWAIEVEVPWSVFQKEVPEFAPEPDAILGFSMVPIDNDDDGADFSQLCWFRQDEQLGVPRDYDFGGWAHLRLLAPVIVEEPEPEAAPEAAPEAVEAAPEAAAAPQAAEPAAQTSDIFGIVIATAAAAAVVAAVSAKKRKD